MPKGKKKFLFQNKRTFSFSRQDSNSFIKRRSSSKTIRIKGQWTSEEDDLLLEWVTQNGAKRWTKCAKSIPGRNAKQCREHWNNSLNSEVEKGNWSSEEDFLIMRFYKKFQSWKKMIPIFKSRTENSIKNRFYSELRKIASKYIVTTKKDRGKKFSLDIILKFLDTGLEEAEKKYLKEHPMTKKELEEYINKIDLMLKNKPKGQKFIDLNIAQKKQSNIIDINENEEELKGIKKKLSKTIKKSDSIKQGKQGRKPETRRIVTVIEDEEKNEQKIVPKKTKTYQDLSEILIENYKNKKKSGEIKNNIEEKNDMNLTEKKK